MNRTVKFNKWTAIANRRNITVDKFVFAPSEGEKMTALLSFAGRMAGLQALPAEISDPPFTVDFHETGLHVLRRDSNSADLGITFSFEEIDDLIQLVNACREVVIDIITHAPKNVGHQSLNSDAPDIIEGR